MLPAHSDSAERMHHFLSLHESHLIPRVRRLRCGESLLIPGGWGDPSADTQQIVLFVLQRERGPGRRRGRFRLTVVNCGDGVQHHEQRAEPHGEQHDGEGGEKLADHLERDVALRLGSRVEER